MSYTSSIPFEAVPLRDLVVHGSDGRVGRHVDDFLRDGLGLSNYDRMALPGGPACFAGHPAAHVQQANVTEELRFLVEAHELERVVLITHQGCGFYRNRMKLPDDELERRQKADLQKAADAIREFTSIDNIQGFFLRIADDDAVSFEPVALT